VSLVVGVAIGFLKSTLGCSPSLGGSGSASSSLVAQVADAIESQATPCASVIALPTRLPRLPCPPSLHTRLRDVTIGNRRIGIRAV